MGSIRRECLNHVPVLGERHLHRILTRYLAYYHQARTHLALDKDAPDRRQIELPATGRVVQLPEVGGLHHRYIRQAAVVPSGVRLAAAARMPDGPSESDEVLAKHKSALKSERITPPPAQPRRSPRAPPTPPPPSASTDTPAP
ncbi:MAG TPA: hypothetical protein VFV05_07835 [Methylomirabilota bacterium]|nr:hypothetical protein [Methylomirabilota bacterium]